MGLTLPSDEVKQVVGSTFPAIFSIFRGSWRAILTTPFSTFQWLLQGNNSQLWFDRICKSREEIFNSYKSNCLVTRLTWHFDILIRFILSFSCFLYRLYHLAERIQRKLISTQLPPSMIIASAQSHFLNTNVATVVILYSIVKIPLF